MRYTTVIGEAAARMPICGTKPGINAGLSFTVPKSFGQYVQANAAQILAERALELAKACHGIEKHQELPGVALDQPADGEELSRRRADQGEEPGMHAAVDQLLRLG